MLSLTRRFPGILLTPRRLYSASYTSTPPNPQQTSGERTIIDKLTAKFSPSQLQVQDVSGIYQRTVYDVQLIIQCFYRGLWRLLCHYNSKFCIQGPVYLEAAPDGADRIEGCNKIYTWLTGIYLYSIYFT